MSRGQNSHLPSVNGLPAKNKKSPCVQMGGLCWLHNLVISVRPWLRGQVSVPAIREMGCSVRGTDLTCWVLFGGDVPGKPFCSGVYTLSKAGAAGSGSSLHWILSKPQDCSKALDWLGYSLVDRPQPAPDSPHHCHNLAEAFPVVILILTVLFPLWL